MSAAPQVSVIIPGLNEAPALEELFQRTAAVLDGEGLTWEFIFVDDGSSDETVETLKRLQAEDPRLGYVCHFRNHGKSMALMQGFDMARGDIAITMDADLQDQPEDIPLFLRKLDEGYDFVNGWRHKRKDTGMKRYVSRLYNRLIRRLFNTSVQDINCGFKAYRRKVYTRVVLRGDLHRLVPVLVGGWGFKVDEVPVGHKDRKHGDSRYNLVRLRGLLDIITVMASNTSQLRPFHVLTEISVVFWLLAILFFGGWRYLGGSEMAVGSWGAALCVIGMGWAVLMGSLLPLIGFLLEVLTSFSQDHQWRTIYTDVRSFPQSGAEADVSAPSATSPPPPSA